MSIQPNMQSDLQLDVVALRRRLRWRASVVAVGIVIVVGALLYFSLQRGQSVANERVRETISAGLLEEAHASLLISLHAVTEYIALLRGAPGMAAYLADPEDSKKKVAVIRDFTHTADVIGSLDQIRLIGLDGMEMVRVNHRDGETWVTADEDLQNKADRYYVIDALELAYDELYFSAIDLNIEHDRIEPDMIWTLRLVTPVKDANGTVAALLVVNYNIEQTLTNVTNLASGAHAMVYDGRSGAWLYRTDREVEPVANFSDIARVGFAETSSDTEALFLEKVAEGSPYGNVAADDGTHIAYAILELTPNTNTDVMPHKYIPFPEFTMPFSVVKPAELSLYMVILTDKTFVAEESGLISKATYGIVAAFLALLLLAGLFMARAYGSRRAAELWAIRLKSVFALMNKTMRHDLAGKLTNVKYGIETSGIEGNEALDMAYASVQSGVELIHQMKQLEKIAEEGVRLTPTPLRSTIEDVVARYSLPIAIDGDEVHVLADPGLASVFDNLIRNAIVHSGTDRMEIGIRQDNDVVYVTVSDFGKGIPKKFHTQLFDEGFKHGETANTGLGLYIVDQVIRRYGGSVKYRDTLPKGATFVLTLRKA